MSSTLHPMLNVAIKAARTAGTIINRAALDVESVRVSAKQTNDFVTEVDHAAEAAIIDTLLTAYPDHAIWAEESGRTPGDTAAQTTSGSSTRWTAPPTSSTVSRSTA
jgi:myo-inositol-1(or 4)-monophosphatase